VTLLILCVRPGTPAQEPICGGLIILMVGAADGFGGKLILTVSFLDLPWPGSSPAKPVVVRLGGRSGGIAPPGWGSGRFSSRFMRF